MIDTPMILVDNRFADGVVTATSTEIYFSAMHLTDWREHTYYRSKAGATQRITVDCGSAKAADSVGLAIHNLARVGASVAVECSSDNFVSDITIALASEPVLSTGIFFRRFAPQTKQFWRLSITGLSGAIYIAIAVIGVAVVIPEPLMSDYTPQMIEPESAMNISEQGHPLGVMMGIVMARSRWLFDRIYNAWFVANLQPLWDTHFSRRLPAFFVPTYQAHPEDVFLYRVVAESGFSVPVVKGGRRRLGLDLLGLYQNGEILAGDFVDGLVCPVPDPGAIPFVNGGTGVGLTGAIVLGVGENNTKIDVGYYKEGSIGNYVWIDTNGDGIQNEAATGINGVIVELWNYNKTVLIDRVVTANDGAGAAGYYRFDRVAPNYYYIRCIQPVGYSFSPANIGSDTLDSDVGANGWTASLSDVGVGDGEQVTNVDIGLVPINGGAGFVPAAAHVQKTPLPAPPPLKQSGTPSVGSFVGTSSIGDRVWKEVYANGVQDDNEVGKSGVYVYLHVADMSSGTAMPGEFIASRITDANGNYSFSSLAAGTYVLKFAATDGSVLTAAKVTTYYDLFSGTTKIADNFIDSDAYRTYPIVPGC